jgi:hypothetical protein
MCYRRREPSLRSRGLIAILAVAFSGAAMAQTANPFAFLFGGPPPWEGRSAYGPGAVYPPSPYREYHPGGYSSPPDYYDPYEYEPPRVYRPRRPPVEVDRRGPDAPSPQEVWRRLRPLRVGRVRSDLSSMIQRYAQAMS